MSQDNERERSVQVTIAIIGCSGTIIAAIVSGFFLIMSVSISRPTDSPSPGVVKPIYEVTPEENPQQNQLEPQESDDRDKTINELATAVAKLNLPIDSSTVRETAPLPSNFTCPSMPGAGWLNFPLIWYGPYYDRNGISYVIGYDSFQIFVLRAKDL